MRLLLFLLFFISCGLVQGSDSIPVFILHEPLQSSYNISKEVQQSDDPSCTFTINDAIHNHLAPASAEIDTRNGYCGWLRFAIKNSTGKPVFYLLRLPWLDTTDLYEVHGSIIQQYVYGKLTPYRNKLYTDAYNNFTMVLKPGETKTFYVSVKTDDYYAKIYPVFRLQNEMAYRSLWYFWGAYLGVSLLLIIISIGLGILFRDWKYFLLALPIVGVLLFFGDWNGDMHVLLNTSPQSGKNFNHLVTSWFCPVSYFVFIALYTGMKKHVRWAFYTVITLCFLLFCITIGIYLKNRLNTLGDYTIIGTDLFCFFVLLWMALKRRIREAKVTLLFLSPLMLTVIYMLLAPTLKMQVQIDIILLTQIASLISTLIIGYELYHRVRSTIRERMDVLRQNQQLMLDQNIMLEEKVRERTQQLQERSFQLQQEKKKSDDLLLNILPSEVAEELKERGNTEAKQFDEVSVMFTDFVNFTRAGETMSAKELVDELHTCFKAFDEIIEKYNIEKIKTIGDAYLAVSGLPVADKCHATNMVNAALEIVQFMNHHRQRLGDKSFDIRIGIHSGSVVAGIVGVKKFAYDIWGDTVNTAARMEQASEPGKINISQTTFELVKNDISCEFRGEIKAKNKGAMKMYFVESSITVE